MFCNGVGIHFRHMNLINALLQIVSKKSARIGVSHEKLVPVEGDHRRICRIKDEDEHSFQIIVHQCQKLDSGIPEKRRRK